jgi:RNA polymerase sigma factor (sigma-70 family)
VTNPNNPGELGKPGEPTRQSTTTPNRDLDGLFERNLPMLIAFLRARVGNALAARESIQDLCQSVCREVLRDQAALTFPNDESFRAFLFLQASRKVVDRARYHRMAMRDPDREVERLDDGEARDLLAGCAEWLTPSRALADREGLARVEAAIRDLPHNQSEAVMLSRIGGVSYPEIARQLGTTVPAVRSLTARGLAKLAASLGVPKP